MTADPLVRLRALQQQWRESAEYLDATVPKLLIPEVAKQDAARCRRCADELESLVAALQADAPPQEPPSAADEEFVRHLFVMRSPYGDGLWCKHCDYHRDHDIHAYCPHCGAPAADAPRANSEAPPTYLVDYALAAATCSPCRSKRGVVVFRGANLIAKGLNYKPRGFDCDGSDACKATCRKEAIHAEQQALLFAGRAADGCDLLHVKAVDGKLVPSGGPSCVECSKLALIAGIAGVWLYHVDGWKRYEMADFHRLSLIADAPRAEPPQEWQPIATVPTDGRMILVYPSSCWTDDTEGNYEVTYWDTDDGRLFQRCDPDDYTGPTHWMKLPEPPVASLSVTRDHTKE